MLLRISALSCCATRYIDAHSSGAQSESGKRGTRGRGFHKGVEENGTQGDLPIVEGEGDRQSAEKECRSRAGGGWRWHRKQSGTSPRSDEQRSPVGRAAHGVSEKFRSFGGLLTFGQGSDRASDGGELQQV